MLCENDKGLYADMQNDRIIEYSVCNELLDSGTDIIKDSYLKMLGVVLRQGDDINEYQQTLFNGIVAGINVNYEAIDYLRMAKRFDEADIKVFVEVCNPPPLQYRFVLDSLILSVLSKNNNGQFELISYFCELFKIENDVVKFLASMAKSIVEMNLVLYANTCYEKPVNIIDKVYYGYFVILQSYLKDIENMTIIQGLDFIKEPVEVDRAIVNEKLTLINLNLSTLAQSKIFDLSNINKIFISGCIIEGNEYPIKIENSDNVKFLNTTFMNFNKRTLLLESVGGVFIGNSEFRGCYNRFERRHYYGARDDVGGVIYSKNNNNGVVVLDNCRFVSCGTINSKGAIAAPCIANIDCDVRNCVFKHCFCQNNNRVIFKEPRYMFTAGSTQVNCSFFNSPEFN